MKKLPVVAAIPNYNMGEQLRELLPQLTRAGYDEIYVLDDNSADDSREITASAPGSVHFVSGDENKGAGANRNRVIDALRHPSVIHFLDADVTLQTERAAEVVREAVPAQEFGLVGGLALAGSGLQSVWNYGPRQSLWADFGGQLQMRIEPLLTTDPPKAARLRERFEWLLRDWPDPLRAPVRRRVYWAIEQNLIINSETLSELGGFDETLREHEIQDLAIRMASRGLKRYFDPSIVTQHKEIEVREYDRSKEMIKSELRIARKHGLMQWLLPGGRLRPTL